MKHALIVHSSIDRKTVVAVAVVIDIVDDNWSCFNNHPNSYHCYFDIANFSAVYADHNYFDMKLHRNLTITTAIFVDCHFCYHHGYY